MLLVTGPGNETATVRGVTGRLSRPAHWLPMPA
jgi:hypothetical protein